MRLLLDTHAFLWFVFGDTKLPPRARAVIEDQANSRHLSLASVWELTIKYGLGKLQLDRPIEQFVRRETTENDIAIEGILAEHIFELLSLPDRPRDPFDRLIAAQCRVEGMHLISVDKAFDEYGVRRIWD